MKRKFVTIQEGALTGMVGEHLTEKKENKEKVFIKDRTFLFGQNDFRPSTFDEIFNAFIKDEKIVSMSVSDHIEQKFANGWSIYIDRNGTIIYDNEGNEIIRSI